MYGHVGLTGLLTFPEKSKDGGNGAKTLKILHLALAFKIWEEYTTPCIGNILNFSFKWKIMPATLFFAAVRTEAEGIRDS